MVVNTSEGGVFYADGSGGTSLTQLAALPSHTHDDYVSKTWVEDNYLSNGGGTVNGSITANTLNTQSSIWASKSEGYGVTLYGTADEAVIGVHTNGNWKCPNLSLFANSNVTVHGDLLVNGGITGNLTGNADSANTLRKAYSEDINYNAGASLKLIYARSDGSSKNFASDYQSGLSVMTNYTGWQMTSYGGDVENPYFRSLEDDGFWKPWRKLAFIDDNVASATKLETSRTIWGQSFDGTNNIHGALKNCDYICSENMTTDGYMIGLASKGAPPYEGLLLFTYGSTPITMYTNSTERMRILSNGNVTIGGTTADEKLHVHGNLKANNFIGNVTGNVSGSSGSCTGNSATATLATTANRLNTINITADEFAKAQYSGFYNVSKSTTANPLPDDGQHGHVAIHAAWDNGNNTAGLDLLVNDSATSHLYFRSRVGGGNIGAWKTILDSSNYTSYCASVGHGHNQIIGNANSANPANALLKTGSGRPDASPAGDTWIFFDEAGSTSTPWGFMHDQGDDSIVFYGAGVRTSYIKLRSGQIHAANFITDSDRRLKTNIHEISSDKLSNSLNLNFVEFDYINNDNHSAGHIAQEVREVLPEFVHGEESETEHLSIDYTGLHSVQIAALKSENDELKSIILNLIKRIEVLEKTSK